MVPSADWTFLRDAVGGSSICDDDRSEHEEENEDCSLLAAPGLAAEPRGTAMPLVAPTLAVRISGRRISGRAKCRA
jgi:hypothetical protein